MMVDSKVRTMIVNATEEVLTMKVGNSQCFAKLSSVVKGGHHLKQIDLNWTYQEFLLDCVSHSYNKLVVNSDNCCDYELITITEVDGKFNIQKDLREQFRRTSSSAIEESSSTLSAWKSWLYKFTYAYFFGGSD